MTNAIKIGPPATAVEVTPAQITRTAPDRESELIADAGRMFAGDIEGHAMTVLHEDGLYRHVRFRGDSLTWFDVITWPGNLAIKGCHGGFMFYRQDDMFDMFRGGQINAGWWAEKTPDGRRSVREYDEDGFRARLAGKVAEYENRFPMPSADGALPGSIRIREITEVRDLIAEYDDAALLCSEDGARRLLAELRHYGVVGDTSEWDLQCWDFHFLWSCHAIQWGIAQYEAARVPAVTS